MNKIVLSILVFTSVASAQTPSALYQEFTRRDSLKLTPDQGAVINFLKILKFPVDSIIEIETLGGAQQEFLLKDKSDNVCFGSISNQILRCKNVIGITGVTYQGDAD
jgi:hypothetical protein